MMPYSSCAGDPPSHCSAGQLLHFRFFVGDRVVKYDSSHSDKFDHATVPFRRSWRWGITALLAMICILLMLLTMESAIFVDTTKLPAGSESIVRDQANKSAGESDLITGWPTASNVDDAKKITHDSVVPVKETKDWVDQSQFRNRGLSISVHKLEPVLNFNYPQQVGAEPWSHMRRRRRVSRTGLTFSNRRILVSSVCTNKDISIFQSPDGSSGIPRYAVQIMNNCMSDCPPSDIHVFCGWFASALLVNPNSFKRIAFNDCLVNGGKPLRRGETLRFTYANSFMYPLRFKSASFCK